VWKRSWCDAAATLSAQLLVARPLCFLRQMCAKSAVFDLKLPGFGNASRGGARGCGAGGAQP